MKSITVTTDAVNEGSMGTHSMCNRAFRIDVVISAPYS